jgi:hypothetical protein
MEKELELPEASEIGGQWTYYVLFITWADKGLPGDTARTRR